MEKYNAHEDANSFAQKEQQRYLDALCVLNQKIEIADSKFGGW